MSLDTFGSNLVQNRTSTMKLWDQSELAGWVARSIAGDESAWGRLVDHFQSLVYSIPKRIGLSAEDCDDVFQTTFLALHKNLDKIQDSFAIAKWLSVTATRESLRIKKLSSRSLTVSSDTKTLDETLADIEATAEEGVIKAVEADIVRKSVLNLPEKCRELLSKLFFDDQTSYEQIALDMNIALGSIGPTKARCLEKLRSILEKSGFFGKVSYFQK